MWSLATMVLFWNLTTYISVYILWNCGISTRMVYSAATIRLDFMCVNLCKLKSGSAMMFRFDVVVVVLWCFACGAMKHFPKPLPKPSHPWLSEAELLLEAGLRDTQSNSDYNVGNSTVKVRIVPLATIVVN